MRSKESRRRRKEEGKKERERDMKLHVAGRTFRSTCTLSPSPSYSPSFSFTTTSTTCNYAFVFTYARPSRGYYRPARSLFYVRPPTHTNIRTRTLALVKRTCVPCAAVESGGKNVEEKERIKEMMKNGEKKKYCRGLSSRSRCYPPKIPF